MAAERALAVDLRTPRQIHLVGIGGSGMSAIAAVLVAMGHQVSGSDLKGGHGLERLRALGVEVFVGHRPENIGGAELLAISTAVPVTNPEVVTARERGIPCLRRADVLAGIAAQRRTLAVAGTHGKTTTSSMLALVLVEAGLRPSFIVGGEVNEVGSGAAWDEGDWFVVEADESDGTFLELGAEAVVVTSVEPDHLEHYGSFDALVAAFDRFVEGAQGLRVVCADDPVAAALAQRTHAVTYGTSEAAAWQMRDVRGGRAGIAFMVEPPAAAGLEPVELRIPVPGLHNARNACAALVAARSVGAPIDAIVRALRRYGGVARRYQFRGEASGVTFVDDYAHLPTEVAAAIGAARDGGWRRIVAVFQPHRYSRTASLWEAFADAFVAADIVVVTDIYPAGEPPRPGVSGRLIIDAVLTAHPTQRVVWLPTRRDLLGYLAGALQPGDLCLTLGAGDVTSLADDLLPALTSKGSS